MAVSPVPGSWDLQEGAGFFGLVDAQTIGSQKYAFVVFDGGGVLLGFQLTSDGYLGTETATADIYRLNGPVFDGIVAEDASVYDPSKWLAGATSGYRGLCTRQGGKFYVNQSACEIPGV
jgi:hypothetical protein